jgi:hypothetical protein
MKAPAVGIERPAKEQLRHRRQEDHGVGDLIRAAKRRAAYRSDAVPLAVDRSWSCRYRHARRHGVDPDAAAELAPAPG